MRDSDERNKSLDIILKNQDTALRNHEASIHNLETQVGQIAKLLSERPPGSLPGNTETNPREHLKAVTLRSGRELQPEVREEKKKKPREPSEEHLVSKSGDKQV